jgi:hypothetical protein
MIRKHERKHLAERGETNSTILWNWKVGYRIDWQSTPQCNIHIGDILSSLVDINESIILKYTLIIHCKDVNRIKQVYWRDQWCRAVTSGVWLKPVA